MPAPVKGSAYGRELDARMKELIRAHKEGLAAARESGDKEAEKFCLEGCQYIDTLAKGAYSISQEFDTLPPAAYGLKKMTREAAGNIFETSITALEMRASLIKGKKMPRSAMGENPPPAAPPLRTEASFYSDGVYDWYNPADWIGKGEWEAYSAAMLAVQTAQAGVAAIASSAADAADKASKVLWKNLGYAAALGLTVYAVKHAISHNEAR